MQNFKKLIKEFTRVLLMTMLIGSILIVSAPVNAQSTGSSVTATSGSTSGTNTNCDVKDGNNATNVINKIGCNSALPGFDAGHSKQSYQAGASNITSAIYFIIDFLKYALGSIAVLMIIVSGLKLILSGKKVDDVTPKQKENLKFVIMGLIIVLLADALVKQVFFGEQGEVYLSNADLQQAALRGTNLFKGIYNFIEVFVGSLAVLFFVLAGFRLVVSGGDPEQLNKAKKQMTWAVIGLLLAGLAEFVVKGIIFPDQGSRLSDLDKAKQLLVSLTNFASGFISVLAVTMLIYAGYLYVISRGGDDTGKAKKVLTGAIIGLFIALGAFALVNTFIKVEPLKNAPTVPAQQQNLNIPKT